ncbi:helix-turn-helix domain-containing protein [Allosalinactinospora lopnorensis]|uniref:helix-turn-helix domain-containing protein n=1 Tax=Allosalinactinospora lopnorensis TaxID=1352348 RepID=UPI00373FDDEA
MPPLTRPQTVEARRRRAAELLEQGCSQAEVARMAGVSPESVRRWKRQIERGGTAALRRARGQRAPAQAHRGPGGTGAHRPGSAAEPACALAG